jgi:hypothetical protein
MEIIKEGKGAHFDPQIIDALLRIEEEFIAVAREFSGDEAPSYDCSDATPTPAVANSLFWPITA